MLEGLISLVSYGYSGAVGNLFSQLETVGVFSFLLPILLIFSLIYGVLSRIKIFESNQALNAIIALAVSLMAMQSATLSNFFAIISPQLGVGLVILLVVMIMVGMFFPKEAWVVYVVFGIAAIITINILLNTAEMVGSSWYGWWLQWKSLIITLVIIGIVLSVIVSSTKKDKTEFGTIAGGLLKKLVD